MEAKRHTCIVCNKKRADYKMKKFRSNWACLNCLLPVDIKPAALREAPGELRVLNLYAGIGGNRKFWPDSYLVTAVELNPVIAAAYKKLFPLDVVIVTDAHQYLLKNYFKFDIIWTSPSCVTHSRLNYIFKPDKKRYPDMSLYQQIVFLRAFFSGLFVVENVIPYYDALIKPDFVIDRHFFWANFNINTDIRLTKLKGFARLRNGYECTPEEMKKWLGISLEKNIYLSGKNSVQVYRNCLHPLIGKSILADAINSL